MSDFDPLVTLVEVEGEFKAQTIAVVLESAGIEAHVFVLGNLGLPMPLSPGAKGIPVMVRRSQLERARTTLSESLEVGASVDWESVDVGEETVTLPARRGMAPALMRVVAIIGVSALAAGTALSVLGSSRSAAARVFMVTLIAAVATTAIVGLVRERWNRPS